LPTLISKRAVAGNHRRPELGGGTETARGGPDDVREISDCRLPIADWRRRIADFRLNMHPI
jgi:hypothetical protein